MVGAEGGTVTARSPRAEVGMVATTSGQRDWKSTNEGKGREKKKKLGGFYLHVNSSEGSRERQIYTACATSALDV
jgi:hypothetical protein